MKQRTAKQEDLARGEAMVVVAHPDPTSLNHAFAHAVFGALTEAGLDTTLFDLQKGSIRSSPVPRRVAQRVMIGTFSTTSAPSSGRASCRGPSDLLGGATGHDERLDGSRIRA
jgi:hypothetical protein